MAKICLSLNVSHELNNEIETIANETGTTKSGVIRRAIFLLKSAHEAKKDGYRVGFSRDAGKLEREVIIT